MKKDVSHYIQLMNLSSRNQYRTSWNGKCNNSIKPLVNRNPDGLNGVWMKMDHW